METVLQGTGRPVRIRPDGPVVIIGEKINPTGRPVLQARLQRGDFDAVVDLAVRQVAAGAQVLDINVGVPGLDEVALMREAVRRVAAAVDVPLCIDSPDPAVIAAGLEVAPGKPLVNSVSGEEARLRAVLPLVQARGAAVVGLIMDETGIPPTPEARLAVARQILEQAAALGIPPEEIVIDPLAMAVGADARAAALTLRTIALVQQELGTNITLGASNVSFGLPERPTLNAAFLALAIQAGLTCAITDPLKLAGPVRACDLLLGRDEYAAGYLRWFRRSQAATRASAPAGAGS